MQRFSYFALLLFQWNALEIWKFVEWMQAGRFRNCGILLNFSTEIPRIWKFSSKFQKFQRFSKKYLRNPQFRDTPTPLRIAYHKKQSTISTWSLMTMKLLSDNFIIQLVKKISMIDGWGNFLAFYLWLREIFFKKVSEAED